MLLLYALREGRERVQAMFEDRSISKEIYDSIRRELDAAWKLAVPRAHPDLVPGEADAKAKAVHTRIDALNVGGAKAHTEPSVPEAPEAPRTDTAVPVGNAAAEERRPSP